MDQEFLKKLNYSWQHRLFLFSAASTFLLLLFALLFFFLILFHVISLNHLPSWIRPLLMLALFLIFCFPAVLTFSRLLAFFQPKQEAVRITCENYPDLLHAAENYSDCLGIPLPQLWLAGGKRPLGSCHGLGRRQAIVLHSDVVEAEKSQSHYAVARFELARQMGLLCSGERSFSVEFLTAWAQKIPYLSALLSKAETYTADRWAAALAPDAAAAYFSFLAVGKGLWPDQNLHQMAQNACNLNLWDSLSSWFRNSNPLPWRILGLAPSGIFNVHTRSLLHSVQERPEQMNMDQHPALLFAPSSQNLENALKSIEDCPVRDFYKENF